MNNTLVYIHRLAADHLARHGNREDVVHFINALESNPETVGDYRQPDPRGRMIYARLEQEF